MMYQEIAAAASFLSRFAEGSGGRKTFQVHLEKILNLTYEFTWSNGGDTSHRWRILKPGDRRIDYAWEVTKACYGRNLSFDATDYFPRELRLYVDIGRVSFIHAGTEEYLLYSELNSNELFGENLPLTQTITYEITPRKCHLKQRVELMERISHRHGNPYWRELYRSEVERLEQRGESSLFFTKEHKVKKIKKRSSLLCFSLPVKQ